MGRPVFMVITDAGAKKHFRVVEYIQTVWIQEQAHTYFGLQGIGNVDIAISNTLSVSDLENLARGDAGWNTLF